MIVGDSTVRQLATVIVHPGLNGITLRKTMAFFRQKRSFPMVYEERHLV
jgi:hypothetical protein